MTDQLSYRYFFLLSYILLMHVFPYLVQQLQQRQTKIRQNIIHFTTSGEEQKKQAPTEPLKRNIGGRLPENSLNSFVDLYSQNILETDQNETYH